MKCSNCGDMWSGGNELQSPCCGAAPASSHDMKADVELALCEDAFDMWMAQNGDGNAPEAIRIIMNKAWNAGWLGGLERGSSKTGSLVMNTALNAVKDFPHTGEN